jgi:hypothetical protein
MSSLPTIDQNILGWIITGGLVAIFVTVWRVAVRIEGRIARLEERMKNLENNPLFVGYREFQIAQAKKIFSAEEMLKAWEIQLKDRLSQDKEGKTNTN